MSSRIPALLEPYLALPSEASLILITNVLGASSNWLVLRYLYSYLKASSTETAGEEPVSVVFTSFLRDFAFWKDGAGRMGLDLDAIARAGRFTFVDGLTQLCLPEARQAREPSGQRKAFRSIERPDIDHIKSTMNAALGDLATTKKIIVIDQLDALLAVSDDEITSTLLGNMLLSLREHAHSTILTMAADSPLLHSQTTVLEREHAALVLGQAHAADTIVALRMLDTGTARDVSGVARITAGGLGAGAGTDAEGREYLYFVAGDGNVKVFERGT